MKNKKTKRLIAVVVAVLFSLTIIGGVLLSCLSSKNETVTASADSTVNCWNETVLVPVHGTYLFDEDLNNVDLNRWSTGGDWHIIRFPFLITVPYGTNYSSFCQWIAFEISSERVAISYNIVYDDISDWTEEDVYRSNEYGWLEYHYRIITLDTYVPRSFYLFLKEFAEELYVDEIYENGYDVGYGEGYSVGDTDGYSRGYSVGDTDGYSRGHTVGYSEGLNKGHSDSISNPISSFLEPVHQFMNTPFFGTLTFASIFNIVLFVLLAIIFIKMFAGG